MHRPNATYSYSSGTTYATRTDPTRTTNPACATYSSLKSSGEGSLG